MSEYPKTPLKTMTPSGELRAVIPIGLTVFKLGVVKKCITSAIGNMIPTLFIIFSLQPASSLLSKNFRLFKWFLSSLFEPARKKHSHKFEILKEIRLVKLVAIPLLGTSAWSGALTSFVFEISPKKSLPLIFLGLLINGVIINLLALGGEAVI